MDQTGLMRGRCMTPQIHVINQLIQKTYSGLDAWFLGADPMKAYDKVSFVFSAPGLCYGKVPLIIV